MNAYIVMALLISGSAFAQAMPPVPNSVCLQASFGSQVNVGASFSQSLGNGLSLHLNPRKDDWGWQASISPEGSDDDWAYPVNPPLRFGNTEYLGTGYGEFAREALYPHEIRFPLAKADYSRMFKLAYQALWPNESSQPDKAVTAYFDALKTVRTGAVILSPLEYDKGGPHEKVRWMKFNAVVVVPKGFRGEANLDWKTGSCSPMLRSGKNK